MNSEFQALGLSPKVLDAIQELGFETPTPVQSEAIPHVLEGVDVMGLAQTGTGKTAAFGLPLVHQLLEQRGKPAPKTVRSLILAPTRELVNQIADNIRLYVHTQKLKVTVVMGGVSVHGQRQKLARGTDILVATPGRLLDLAEKRLVDLSTVSFLVLDEADQMLDLGFIHTLRKLEKMTNSERQTLLFSATMPKQIEALSKAFLSDPVRIEAATPGRAADKIRQSVHFVESQNKMSLLKSCLAQNGQDVSMVFARTKHGAEKLKKQLVANGFAADSIHGNKNQSQRERTLAAFRRGDVNILVATDVAARGIDIPGVTHVYNYDLPEVPENYVHRIGRTARAGAEGEAVAFCSAETVGLLKSIEKLMGLSIEVASGERMEEQAASGPKRRGRRSQGGRNDARQDNAPKKRRRPAAKSKDAQRNRADSEDGHAPRSAKPLNANGKPARKKKRRARGRQGSLAA